MITHDDLFNNKHRKLLGIILYREDAGMEVWAVMIFGGGRLFGKTKRQKGCQCAEPHLIIVVHFGNAHEAKSIYQNNRTCQHQQITSAEYTITNCYNKKKINLLVQHALPEGCAPKAQPDDSHPVESSPQGLH